MSLEHYKPNELEMALRIANKAIDQLLAEKPKGGLIVNKGEDTEAKMSYKEAKKCLKRIERKYGVQGAFSLGICGGCRHWNTVSHCTGDYKDFGDCRLSGKATHRYDSCDKHSKENGGWGL